MNTPIPYQGNDPFIFFSYAHKNRDAAFDLIRQLIQNGFRVWYDDGIDPGTRWAEYIASHVESCAAFLAFISEEYIDSSNCLDELEHARNHKKPRLLIHLTNVKLTGGLQMQHSRIQALHMSDANFFGRLFDAGILRPCRSSTSSVRAPAPQPIVRTPVQSSPLRAPAPQPVVRTPVQSSPLRAPAPQPVVRTPVQPSPLRTPAPQPSVRTPIPACSFAPNILRKDAFDGVSRPSVRIISFFRNLRSMGADAQHVGEPNGGSVMMWVKPLNGGMINLCFGAHGTIFFPKDCSGLLADFPNLTKIYFNGAVNTNRTVNMCRMFDGCPHLTELDLSAFNTSLVSDMSGMFRGCASLTQLDLTTFDTRGVRDMSSMFCDCVSLTSVAVGKSFNVLKQYDHMFFNCGTDRLIRNFL